MKPRKIMQLTFDGIYWLTIDVQRNLKATVQLTFDGIYWLTIDVQRKR